MSTIRPFKALRPHNEFAAQVASRPYDVLNSEEARQEVAIDHHQVDTGRADIFLSACIDQVKLVEIHPATQNIAAHVGN